MPYLCDTSFKRIIAKNVPKIDEASMSKKSVKQVVIFCDGACSGNPGPGGWGAIVALNDEVCELGDRAPSTTNNRMEMSALLESFKYVYQHPQFTEIEEVLIYTDSVYVIRGMTQWIFGWKNRGWKTAENKDVINKDIWQQLEIIISQIKNKRPELKLHWNFVRGHTGVDGNERCDKIAVAFSKNDYCDLYKGSVKNYLFDPFEVPTTEPLPDYKKKSDDKNKTVWYISLVNGVFSQHQTWKECEALVKGRAAKFKKVSSSEEEAQIKKTWGL